MDYSKWDHLDSEDEAADPKVVVDPKAAMQDRLLRLKASDPAQLDQLEAELRELKVAALRAKEEEAAVGASPGASIKAGLNPIKNTLTCELDDLERERSALQDQERRLEQLASCGDERSLLDFFAQQGMAPEDLQRAMGGDSEGALADLATRTTQPANHKVEASLQVANKLSAVVKGDELPPVAEAEPVQKPPRGPPVNRSSPEQPDVSQRQPTAEDPSLVVTVSLPELDSAADVKLDIAERCIRLQAPIADTAREYLLTVSLAKRVVAASAQAKWKAKRRELQITLPIAPPPHNITE